MTTPHQRLENLLERLEILTARPAGIDREVRALLADPGIDSGLVDLEAIGPRGPTCCSTRCPSS